VTIAASMALFVSVVGLVARYSPVSNHAMVVIVVASPFLTLAAPVATLMFALAKRWIGAIAAAVAAIVVVAIHSPLLVGASSNADSVPLRVMTANIYFGSADAKTIVAEATSAADVLEVQELTQEAVDRLTAAGLDAVFPYRSLDPRAIASGGGLWSRYPIVESHRIDGYKLATMSARIRVEGAEVDPTVVVAHLPAPWPQPIDDWADEVNRMRGTMQSASEAANGGCVMVAGDFNSTLDMQPFREMLSGAYHDAAEQAGDGPTLTYPGNSRVPPFMGIDHVLTSRCAATSARVIDLPGSDHRGLLATVEIPARR
jgi:endonuclease/exonuclease/phosphatase (EEP) superfamily protein YafD